METNAESQTLSREIAKGRNTMSDPSYAELKAELEEMKKAAAQPAVAPSPAALYFKVSAKGAVSLYGLGRYPVTLYYEQWLKVLERVDQLRSFLEANKPSLRLKNARPEAS